MSNDKKKIAQRHVSRRSLLKYATGGLAVATLPGLPGCAAESEGPSGLPTLGKVEEAALYADAKWVNAIMRRDDLVVLRLGFVNLDVKNTRETRPQSRIDLAGSLFLTRARLGLPAYIIAVFQPQHIFEESFEEPPGLIKPPGTNGSTKPIRSLIAQESRVAFIVPNDVTDLPYELDKLLAAMSGFPLNVPPGALAQSPVFNTRSLVPVFSGLLGAVVDGSPATSKRGIRAARQRQAMSAFLAANPEVIVTAPPKGAELGQTAGVTVVTAAIPAKPQAPTDLQTSIELPFRLHISPNVYARFEHSSVPVKSAITQRVELWHSRLGAPEAWQKTVRAMWTRDHFDPNNHLNHPPASDNPFPVASLTAQDRAEIVHLTTNYSLRDTNRKMRARAVDVGMLALSSLGGWIDGHAAWNKPSQEAPDLGGPSLVAWDHHAPMGRDQKVRAVRVGYLYPFGHEAVWVAVTERKFMRYPKLGGGAEDYSDTAYLWTRYFVIVKEPLKTYDAVSTSLKRGFPFKSVRFKTTVTPNLLKKVLPGMAQSSWCEVGNGAFPFELQAYDHDGNSHDFTAACIWIDSQDAVNVMNASGLATLLEKEYARSNFNDGERRLINMRGQRIAYADCDDIDDTRYTTRSLRLRAATFVATNAVPWAAQLEEAALDVDAIRALTGKSGPTRFSYWDRYLDKGFEDVPGAENAGHVFLALAPSEPTASLDFNKHSNKSGGFVAPSMAVTALSRKQGLVSGNPVDAGKMDFKPEEFFDDALSGAKLFGCIPLASMLKKLSGSDFLKQTPKFITQSVQTAEALIGVIQSAADLVTAPTTGVLSMLADIEAALVAYASNANPYTTPTPAAILALPAAAQAIYPRLWDRGKALGLAAAALGQLVDKLETALQDLASAVSAVGTALDQIATLTASSDQTPVVSGIMTPLLLAIDAAKTISTELAENAVPIQDGARTSLAKLTDKLTTMAPDPATLQALVTGLVAGQEAIKDLHVKLEWAPEISGAPKGAEIFWPNDKHGLKLGIDIRAKDSGGLPAGADIHASLSDFELHLLGSDPFMKLEFDRLVFKAGTAGKPEVDCVFRGMHFAGALKFVEVLKQFIPLDGFSDPPNVLVDDKGLRAQFGLSIPDIALGVFSLTNLSFNAGFEIPFIGKALEVKFSFCKREEPFSLTVCMLGGGGFVGITLTPAGVRLLEIALEAQAAIEVSFGIASGGISVAVGIYLAIEADNCTLSGYVRMRGEVDVMGGLVSASIELELDLTYESANDKVTGHALLEIDVAVLFIHINISLEVTKKFKGNNGDPTLRELMEPFANEVPWEQYCDAFAPVAA